MALMTSPTFRILAATVALVTLGAPVAPASAEGPAAVSTGGSTAGSAGGSTASSTGGSRAAAAGVWTVASGRHRPVARPADLRLRLRLPDATGVPTFDARYATQLAASQGPDETSRRWALLIGVNDHAGRTRDNVGSRQDAELLASWLGRQGWREDHIVLLTDRDATRANIEAGIEWLAMKTDEASVAVFSYAGHTKQWFGRDVDGDGEIPDEALWPSDNDQIPDGELSRRLAEVRAGRMWINIAACEAAGYDDDLQRPGRLLTFSSQEDEKSYENVATSLSVWSQFLVRDAMTAGLGDADLDGDVTVEEAFAHAVGPAAHLTRNAQYGPQHGVMVDLDPEPLSLAVPPSG